MLTPVNKRIWYITGGIVATILVFQLFFRFQYEHLIGLRVMRIDRLTGASCYLPCLATPSPAPPTPMPSNAQLEQEAIALARGSALSVTMEHGTGYLWSGQIACTASAGGCWVASPPSDPYAPPNPEQRNVWLVCWCNSTGYGWRWEVHLDTRAVYSINDNADLLRKYGLPTPTP